LWKRVEDNQKEKKSAIHHCCAVQQGLGTLSLLLQMPSVNKNLQDGNGAGFLSN
jgi:hypothetical protein